jgi:hypothetical protein
MNTNFCIIALKEKFKRMKRLLTLTLLFLIVTFTHAQKIQKYYQNNDIAFINHNGDTLINPFGGGLQFPIFASMDLNFDYIEDIVILDKIDNRILTYVNEGKEGEINFTYRPQYEYLFPDSLSSFIILEDYNMDGLKDIFTYSGTYGAGIGVYKNIGSKANNFNKFKMEYPFLETYMFGNFTFKVNFPMFYVDIPSFVDFDKDGDIDILSFDEFGGAWMQLYENMSQELFESSDSLIFNCIDMSWGNFMENDISNEVTLYRVRPWYYKHYNQNYDSIYDVLDSILGWNDSLVVKNNPIEDPRFSFRGDRHAGSTVFAHDLDGDSDLDLLIGDVEYPGMNLLRNAQADSGLNQARIFENNLQYPMNKPVNIKNMPTLAYIDLDNDGVKDMIFSPTDMDEVDSFQHLKQIWVYKNNGKNDSIDLQFLMDDFLQSEMIDLGGATAPAFFDFDQDGDMDLFVATRGDFMDTYYKSDFMVLYENVSDTFWPIYKAIDSNYLNLRQYGMNFITPAFGDVDNDGDDDMLLGMKNGRLRFFKNQGGAGNTADFVLEDVYFDSIDVGDYSAPFIYDIDEDGYDDILVGSNDGTIKYYKNLNSADYPYFRLENDTFGNINFDGGERQFITPAIADLDTNGYFDMVVGYTYKNNNTDKLEGNIAVFHDISKDLTITFVEQDSFIFDSVRNHYNDRYLGTHIRPAIANMDLDSFPDLILGSNRGGLMYYNTTFNKEIVSVPENKISENNLFKVFPNPAKTSLYILTDRDFQNVFAEIYDLAGKQILNQELNFARNRIDISELPGGMYVLKIRDSESHYIQTERIVKM